MEANSCENKNQFELEKQLIIISVPTISKLLSYGKEGADALLLYNFYYYTAKRQDTNQPKATPHFCMRALGWGEKRFYRADRILREENLIKKEKVFDKKGKIIGWYVRINYIWTTKKVKEANPEPLNGQPEPPNSTTVKNTGSGQKSINALSDNNINALSVNKNNNNKLSSQKKSEPTLTPQQRYFKQIKEFFDNPPQDWLKEMEDSYPPLNIREELKKMKAWLLSNYPSHIKKNLKRFANNWFNRQLDNIKKKMTRFNSDPIAREAYEKWLKMSPAVRECVPLGEYIENYRKKRMGGDYKPPKKNFLEGMDIL